MLSKAIERAYRTAKERKWDTIYWAIDLHGTCIESNYENGSFQFIDDTCEQIMRWLSKQPETKIILWSSVYSDHWNEIVEFFENRGIKIDACNANPHEKSNTYADFSSKFYFSVLLDDKAGFDPAMDWSVVYFTVHEMQAKYGPIGH